MKIIIVHSLTEKQWRLNRLLFLKFTSSWSHLCSSFISVAAIKMPEEKNNLRDLFQLTTPGISSSLQGSQDRSFKQRIMSHLPPRAEKWMHAYSLVSLLVLRSISLLWYSLELQTREWWHPKWAVFPHQLTLIIKTIPTDRPIGKPSPDDYSLKSLPR